MKAKDLMVLLKEYLRPGYNLKKAANILKTSRKGERRIGVKGLPVINTTGKMIGFLSIGDILKSVFPSYMSLMNLGDFTWNGMVEDIAKKVGRLKVSDVMTKNVISVNEDAPLMECIDHMIKNNVKKLPVISKKGRVVGMLYERDIFFAITEAMGNKRKRGKK